MAKRVSDSSYQFGVWKMLFLRGSQYAYAWPTRWELLTTCSELQPRDVFLLHAARPLDVYLCDVAAMFRVDTTLRPFQLILKFLVHCPHHCYIL